MLIPVDGTGKSQLPPGYESVGDAPVLSHCSLLKKILDQSRPVCLGIVMKEEPTAGFPFLGAFPCDCIPKAKTHVNAHFFIHNSNSSNRNEYQVSLLGGGGGNLAGTKG
jgi:hypothetical protein